MGSQDSTSFVSLQRGLTILVETEGKCSRRRKKENKKTKRKRGGVRNKEEWDKIGNTPVVTRSRHVYAYKI